MAFEIIARDGQTRARAGILETAHGIVETPTYVLVGTHAKVRTLNPADLIAAKTQLIIANTYHLWTMLGEDGLAKFPGLHEVMGWYGPLMTDSGGFQVFSFGAGREHATGKVAGAEETDSRHSHILQNVRMTAAHNAETGLVKITEDGVMFAPPLSARAGFTADGKRHWLDAEKSIRIQQQLGADIIVAFDEPTSPRHDYAYTKVSLARTHRWAERSLAARTSSQLLYGVVQGGLYEDLRKASAAFIGALPFDGIAIGGSYSNSFGDSRAQTFRELEWAVPLLPENRPRHLLGIGLIEDLFAGVAAGMDTFDCVVPTREGRHGSIWTRRGRTDITRGRWRDSKEILSEGCACPVCAAMKIKKSDLYGLFHDKNPEAGRLASLHNIWFFNTLMSQIRRSIAKGRFNEFRSSFLPVQYTGLNNNAL